MTKKRFFVSVEVAVDAETHADAEIAVLQSFITREPPGKPSRPLRATASAFLTPSLGRLGSYDAPPYLVAKRSQADSPGHTILAKADLSLFKKQLLSQGEEITTMDRLSFEVLRSVAEPGLAHERPVLGDHVVVDVGGYTVTVLFVPLGVDKDAALLMKALRSLALGTQQD